MINPYCKCPKILDTEVLDKVAYANSTDETADQDLHCLSFH